MTNSNNSNNSNNQNNSNPSSGIQNTAGQSLGGAKPLIPPGIANDVLQSEMLKFESRNDPNTDLISKFQGGSISSSSMMMSLSNSQKFLSEIKKDFSANVDNLISLQNDLTEKQKEDIRNNIDGVQSGLETVLSDLRAKIPGTTVGSDEFNNLSNTIKNIESILNSKASKSYSDLIEKERAARIEDDRRNNKDVDFYKNPNNPFGKPTLPTYYSGNKNVPVIDKHSGYMYGIQGKSSDPVRTFNNIKWGSQILKGTVSSTQNELNLPNSFVIDAEKMSRYNRHTDAARAVVSSGWNLNTDHTNTKDIKDVKNNFSDIEASKLDAWKKSQKSNQFDPNKVPNAPPSDVNDPPDSKNKNKKNVDNSPDRIRANELMQRNKEVRDMMNELIAFKNKRIRSTDHTEEDLTRRLKDLSSDLEDFRSSPTATKEQKSEVLDSFNTTMNKFEGEYKRQTDTIRNIGKYVMTAFSTFQIGSLLNKTFITDPMKYRTMPALQAMGQSGVMGGILSGAMGAEQSWRAETNSQMFGMGTAGMGASMLLGGKARLLGLAAGAGASVLGARGLGDDLVGGFNSVLGLPEGESIRSTELAKNFMNPQASIELQARKRALFLSMGGEVPKGTGADSMGVYTNEKATGYRLDDKGVKKVGNGSVTGDVFTDEIYNKRYNGGTSLKDLGYTAAEATELLTTVGASVTDKTARQKQNLAMFAGNVGTSLGVDPSQIASQFTGMQMAGMTNLQSHYAESMMSVTKDGKAPDQFEVNVLQPALMKVAETLSMRSFSSDANKLAQSVFDFQKSVNTNLSGTQIGDVLGRSPELMQKNTESAGAAIQGMLGSTQGVHTLLNFGGVKSVGEIIDNKNDPIWTHKVALNTIDSLGVKFDKEGKISDNQSNLIVHHASETYKMDSSYLKAIAEGAHKAGFKNLSDVFNVDPSKSKEENQKNFNKVVKGLGVEQMSSELTNTKRNNAEQQNKFEQTVLGMNSKIEKMQTEVLDYTSRSKFYIDLQTGIEGIMAEIKKLTGGGDGKGTPDSSAKEVTTSNANTIPVTVSPNAPNTAVQNKASVGATMDIGYRNLVAGGKVPKTSEIDNFFTMAKRTMDKGQPFAGDKDLQKLINSTSHDLDGMKKVNDYFNKFVNNDGNGNYGVPSQGSSNKPVNLPKPSNGASPPNQSGKVGIPSGTTLEQRKENIKNSVALLGSSEQKTLEDLSGMSKADFIYKGSSGSELGGKDTFNEDQMLSRLIRKTEAEIKKVGKNTAEGQKLSSSLSSLKLIGSMKNGPEKEAMTKAVMASASQTGGVYKSKGLKGTNGSKYNSIGGSSVTGNSSPAQSTTKTKANSNITPSNTPPKAGKPRADNSNSTPSAVVAHNGNQTIQITIEGGNQELPNNIVAGLGGRKQIANI